MLPAILRSARHPGTDVPVGGDRRPDRRRAVANLAGGRASRPDPVLHRSWQVALLTETDIQQLRDLLDLLVTVTHTLDPWLRRWSSTTGPGPDRLLVAFADRVLPDALAGSCRLGFYDDYDGTRELTAWLLDHAWLRVGVRPDGARLDEAFTMLITYPPEQDAEASRRSESRSPTGALCTGHRVRMPISRPQWTVSRGALQPLAEALENPPLVDQGGYTFCSSDGAELIIGRGRPDQLGVWSEFDPTGPRLHDCEASR
jgi:hypothetical protein